MRKLLKQAVCLGLSAVMTLGMCSAAFAAGNNPGGASQATGGPTTVGKPGHSTDDTWGDDRTGLGFRFYLATFKDMVTPSCGWANLNSETILTTKWEPVSNNASVLDQLAEKGNAKYVCYLPPAYASRGFQIWSSAKGNWNSSVDLYPVALKQEFPKICGNLDFGWREFNIKTMSNFGQWGGYAENLQLIFGDSYGKLPSLIAAIESYKSEGAKLQEVITDATDGNSIAALGQAEVQEQFLHYVEWWFSIYSQYTYPSDAISMSEIMTKFEQAKKTATTIVKSGEIGPGVDVTTLKDFTRASENFANYPCIVIEPIAIVAHRNTANVPSGVTFAHLIETGGARQNAFAALSPGWSISDANIITKGNYGSKHLRSPGLFRESRMLAEGDILEELNQYLGKGAGVLWWGFYGALAFDNTRIDNPPGNPEIPPPEIPDETPNDPEIDGDLADFLLMDYEINHVFDSIAEKLRKGNGSHTWMKLGTNQATVNGQVRQTVNCAGDHGPWDDYDTTKYYDVDYQENAGSGPSISMDNAGTKLFLKNNGKYGDTWFYRDEIKSGQTLDSRNVADYTVDYAFNLLRRHFKDDNGKPDNRIYSLLVEQKVTKEYLDNVLGVYEGMMPKDIAVVEEVRDSNARLRAIQDSTSWTSKFNVTGRQVAYDTESKSHSSRYYDGCDDCSGHSCHASWNALKDGPALQGYVVGGSGYAEYSWDIISLAHKYRTRVIPEGYIFPPTHPIDYRETEDQSGSDTTPEPEQYRSTSVITTDTTLEYYPEVPMLGDEVPGPDLTHDYKPIITIGEEKRKTRTPMLLLYRLESASPDVTGTVYTDTAVGGSSYLGTNKVALTAGGDFTVKADTKMTINLYGYAMDIIEPSDPSYAEVTRSNDVKANWGSMAQNREKLLRKYTEWAGVMLNPSSYQADFEMLSGGKKYNSFSATVGGFTTRASNSKEEGSYPLVFKHGDIDKTAQGYKDFIKQLAQDYACSEAEADALFEASEMKQAVIKSIEHDNSSENKSQAQTIGRDQVQLGSSSHWYDEEVRTIVMRRFMTPQGTFKDIIAQDKMDIGNAMEGNAIQNGQFRLTLWFNAGVYTKVFDTIYAPSTGSSNKASMIDNGNIILCGLHVSGADFQLTRSTTATGKH